MEIILEKANQKMEIILEKANQKMEIILRCLGNTCFPTRKRFNGDLQTKKLEDTLDNSDIFHTIYHRIYLFESKNDNLTVNKVIFYRIFRKIWITRKKKSRHSGDININNLITLFIHEPKNENNIKALKDKVKEYKNNGCKFRKYLRLHVIAVLLGLTIYDDNTVKIDEKEYSLPCPYGDYIDIFSKKEQLSYEETDFYESCNGFI
jgi:hypothetical protein